MPSKKKKYNARFPAGRIKKIMQTDDEVGKVAQAVPVIISRTIELFVESLITKTMEITMRKKARTLSPHHMKQCILSESRFDFLKDLVRSVPESSTSDTDENCPSFNELSSEISNRRRDSSEAMQSEPDESRGETSSSSRAPPTNSSALPSSARIDDKSDSTEESDEENGDEDSSEIKSAVAVSNGSTTASSNLVQKNYPFSVHLETETDDDGYDS